MSDLGFAQLFEQLAQGGPVTWGGPYMPDQVDSWLERRFVWQAIKYLRPDVELQPQVGIVTRGGTFRVDFLTAGYRVNLAFECDGAAFHPDREADDIRDSWLLTAPNVWGVYHFGYRDLVQWPEWCFLHIAQRHRDLFTERGRENIRTLTNHWSAPPKPFNVRYCGKVLA